MTMRHFFFRPLVSLTLFLATCVALFPYFGLTPARAFQSNPLTLRVSKEGDGQVELRWRDSSRVRPSGYRVFRRTARGEFFRIQSFDANTFQFTDKDVSNDTDYYYVVRTPTDRDADYESNEVKARPHKGGRNDTGAVVGGALIVGGIIAALSQRGHQSPGERLTKDGPNVPEEFVKNEFSVQGFVRGGWPLRLRFALAKPAAVTVEVTSDKTESFVTRLDADRNGTQDISLTLPERFGAKAHPGIIFVRAVTQTVENADAPPLLRVFEVGCGRHHMEESGRAPQISRLHPASFETFLGRARPIFQASGSVADVHFQPAQIRVRDRETTAYAFLPKSNFDHLKVEFRRQSFSAERLISKVVKSEEIKGGARQGRPVSAEKPWDGREGRRHEPSVGPHILQVRAWDGPNNGSDWIVGWSEDQLLVSD